jgi:hypothetical protein
LALGAAVPPDSIYAFDQRESLHGAAAGASNGEKAMRNVLRTKIVLTGLVLAGCAAYPVPNEQLAISESAIAGALAAGAAEHAAADLRLAQEKLALGKRWIAASDYRPALWLVEQAQVDAELAQMKALSAKARKVAAQMTAEYRAYNTQVALKR